MTLISVADSPVSLHLLRCSFISLLLEHLGLGPETFLCLCFLVFFFVFFFLIHNFLSPGALTIRQIMKDAEGGSRDTSREQSGRGSRMTLRQFTGRGVEIDIQQEAPVQRRCRWDIVLKMSWSFFLDLAAVFGKKDGGEPLRWWNQRHTHLAKCESLTGEILWYPQDFQLFWAVNRES